MQICYSANVRLGGGGMGNSLVEMLRGLHQASLLSQVIVSSYLPTAIPARLITAQGVLGRVQKRLAFYDRSGWGDYLINRIFDRWASLVMRPADIFESWTGFCLSSLGLARRRGMRTLLGLGSAHPRTQLELINGERQRWGLEPLRETPLVRQIERELALADTVVVQSRFSERSLIARGIPAAKLVRIPLGVNVERFRPAEQTPGGPFRVLYLGQVTLRKGVQYLLEAWRQLGWRDAELWVVGQPLPDSQPVLARYADLPGLHLAGYLPDQVAALRSSHAFVLPSVEDGFGLVVTEAMACALPVIVSDQSGAADLIRDGESGLVVRYDDVAAYARALEELRSQPARAQAMGRAARARVLEHTWDTYRERLVALHYRM